MDRKTEKQHNKSFHILLSLAKNGNSQARAMLGLRHYYGAGVKLDRIKSQELLQNTSKEDRRAIFKLKPNWE